MNDEEVDKILKEAIECSAEVEVGEIANCLMNMFQHIQDLICVQELKKAVGPYFEKDVDNFLITLFISQMATITINFKDRERKGAEA